MIGETKAPAAGLSRADQALIEQAKEYSTSAWVEIYDRYYPRIFRHIYYRTRNHSVSEDLAAQVFLEAAKGIKSFRYQGVPLEAWLYRIAHNLVVDHWRRVRSRSLPESLDRVSVASGEDQVDSMVTRLDIMASLARLTADQQQVIVLRFLEGLPIAEVARILGKGEGAIKSLQSRGLASLRRLLSS